MKDGHEVDGLDKVLGDFVRVVRARTVSGSIIPAHLSFTGFLRVLNSSLI